MKITVKIPGATSEAKQPSLDEVKAALRTMMSKYFMEWYADVLDNPHCLKFEDAGTVSLYVPVNVHPRTDIHKYARKMLGQEESGLLSYVGAREEDGDDGLDFTMHFKVKPQA